MAIFGHIWRALVHICESGKNRNWFANHVMSQSSHYFTKQQRYSRSAPTLQLTSCREAALLFYIFTLVLERYEFCSSFIVWLTLQLKYHLNFTGYLKQTCLVSKKGLLTVYNPVLNHLFF